jgi:nitrite reductase (NO-forming)
MVTHTLEKTSPHARFLTIAALLLAAALAATGCSKKVDPVAAQAGAQIYAEKCALCHSPPAGAPRLAPDLAGVTNRRTDEWLTNWLNDTARMQASDPVGKQLLEQWKIPMPPPGLTPEQSQQVIANFHMKDG